MPSKRLEKLKEKEAKLKARIRSIEAKEATRQRKQDTRRKILLGALLAEWMEKDEALKTKVIANLDSFLKRKIDREMFGLPTAG